MDTEILPSHSNNQDLIILHHFTNSLKPLSRRDICFCFRKVRRVFHSILIKIARLTKKNTHARAKREPAFEQ